VADRRSTSVSVFDDPRQAFGWLTSLWAGCLIAVLVWPWLLLRDRLFGTPPSAWVSAASTVLILGLGAANLWGYWASAEARPRLTEAIRQRELAWWERDRFATVHAADRLGWAPRPVVWVTRGLMGLAAITTLTALAVIAARWW
jgi:hypothetical protein